MIRLTIASQSKGTFFRDFANQQEVDAYQAEVAASKHWGEPEKWVHEDDLAALGLSKDNALSSEIVGTPNEDSKRYKFAGYTTSQVDMTEEMQRLATNKESLDYLHSTDWMVIRAMEDLDRPVPADIAALRQEARSKIVR